MAGLRWVLFATAVASVIVTVLTGLQNGAWLVGVLAAVVLIVSAFFPVPVAVVDRSRLDGLDGRCCLVDHAESEDCDPVDAAALRMRADLARDDEERGEWS